MPNTHCTCTELNPNKSKLNLKLNDFNRPHIQREGKVKPKGKKQQITVSNCQTHSFTPALSMEMGRVKAGLIKLAFKLILAPYISYSLCTCVNLTAKKNQFL